MLNYEPITNYTPHHELSPRRRCQDPLDRTRRSLHRHRCRRRPPSPSLSATAAIVAIMGLVVALCRLPPPPSSSLSVILILVVQRRRNPTNDGITAASPPFSSPPAILPLPVAFPPSPPSRSPMAPCAILDWHAASTPSGTTRQVPIPPVPPLSKDRPIVPAPPSRPPRCLGLLSGGRS